MLTQADYPLAVGKARSPRMLQVIPRIVAKVVKEYRRYAKDERVRIVSHAKTAGIPAEFPVVSIDQVRDGPASMVLFGTV